MSLPASDFRLVARNFNNYGEFTISPIEVARLLPFAPAAARLALPPVPPYERYRGVVRMRAAPDSPHRRAALMEAARTAGLHKLTSRVFG